MNRLKRSHITVDYSPIAKWILSKLDETYLGALAMGMCPAPFMDLATAEFERKICLMAMNRADEEVTEHNINVYREILDPELAREFQLQLSMALLNEANRQGILRV